MLLFGHPLPRVRLDVDAVILEFMAGVERHLEATARPLHSNMATSDPVGSWCLCGSFPRM
jgi:hypothetical protein